MADSVSAIFWSVDVWSRGCAGVDTRWAIGNFDKSGELRAIMAALHPAIAAPVRALEYFTNEGLKLLYERLVSRAETPAGFFA